MYIDGGLKREVNPSVDRAWLSLSKAQKLLWLQAKVSSCRILPILTFTVNEWLQQSGQILNRISTQFDKEELIVRSSSMQEDCRYRSNAGAFKSILNVSALSENALYNAINQVVDSMPGGAKDEVLIQPMVTNFQYAGVAATHCLINESPYYTIEYSTRDTFSATAGRGNTHCVYHVRSAFDQQLCMPELKPVLIALKELEAFSNADVPLEIEWALDDSGIVLFQVRALKLKTNKLAPNVLKNIYASLALKAECDVYGAPIYSCMSDWNPAELLGRRPRPLALSLFRHLITQSNWYEARQTMGYQCIYQQDLAVNFGGFVYIDTRASFASLIPESLPRKDADILIQAWHERLKASPELHDKIEFDIVQSCYLPGLLETLKSRYPGALSSAAQIRWQQGLKEITVNAIQQNQHSGLPLAKHILTSLEHNWSTQTASSRMAESSFLLKQSQRGGFAFSIFARCAFIAEEWIRSLVSTGALSETRSNQLRQSVGTVTNRLIDAASMLRRGLLDPQAWALEFGYLRPSNFDICSLPISATDIIRQSEGAIVHARDSNFQLNASESRKITTLLDSSKLPISANQLIYFVRSSIFNREECKFVFSRFLSAWFESVSAKWEKQGLNRNDLSWLSLEDLLPEQTGVEQISAPILKTKSTNKQHEWQRLQPLNLNDVICSAKDVYSFRSVSTRPNFIGNGRHRATIRHLTLTNRPDKNLDNCIICIEFADPGWDWIFTHNIAGIISQYGGPNSHMAVRCAEFDIPAVLGCGQRLFNALLNARQVEVDCDGETIEVVC